MANGVNSMNGRNNSGANVTPTDTAGEIANPQNNSEVYYGSFASILMQNLGQYVVVEFLVGTDRLVTKEGILYSSGINFLSLYDPIENRYIVCDLYAVKFVTFYNTTTVPPSRLRNMSNNNSENTNDDIDMMLNHNHRFYNSNTDNYNNQNNMAINPMYPGMRGY